MTQQLNITGTEINYYFVCKRELWLHVHNIKCEQDSDLVLQGKTLHEASYNREKKEYQFGPIKIDWLDLKNKVIHEVKKSDKMEDAHVWQVKYYIWYLKTNGVGEFLGEINYPKLKNRLEVRLAPEDADRIMEIICEIEEIKSSETPPGRLTKAKICKSCSYYELCFV